MNDPRKMNIGSFDLEDESLSNDGENPEASTESNVVSMGPTRRVNPSLSRSATGILGNILSGFGQKSGGEQTNKMRSGVMPVSSISGKTGKISSSPTEKVKIGKFSVLSVLFACGILGVWAFSFNKHVYAMISDNETDKANLAILLKNKEAQEKEIAYLSNLSINPKEQDEREERLGRYLIPEGALTQTELVNKLLNLYSDAKVSTSEIAITPAKPPEKQDDNSASSGKDPASLEREIFKNNSGLDFVTTISGTEDQVKRVLEMVESDPHFSIKKISLKRNLTDPHIIDLPVTVRGYYLSKKSK